jgi:hypothetical protein
LLAGVVLVPRTDAIATAQLTADESFSWRLTQCPVSAVIRRTARDVHPPLYYLALKVWVWVFDDSPAVLRGLSVLFGALTSGTVYLLVVEARNHGRMAEATKPDVQESLFRGKEDWRWAALFAAFMAAGNCLQVMAGRTARMYALGVFLTALSSWLLLRALGAPRIGKNGADPSIGNSESKAAGLESSSASPASALSCVHRQPRAFRRESLWWAAYGLSTAALLYTHNYGIFTVAAQGLFLVGDSLRLVWRQGWRAAAHSRLGFAHATVVAAILYSPWLGALWHQTAEVRRGYWIRPVTRFEIEHVWWLWSSGTEFGTPVEHNVMYAFLALSLGWLVCRRDRAGWFFLLLWLVPWSLSIGFSLLTGRSIFLDRCLVFAHVGWIGYLAVLLVHLPGTLPKCVFAWVLCSTGLAGTMDLLWSSSRQPAVITTVIDSLKRQHQPGDVVLVGSLNSFNIARYYAKRAGMGTLDVRAPLDSRGQGHRTHVASLDDADLYLTEDELAGYRRIWTLLRERETARLPAAVICVRTESYTGGDGPYRLSLYERE